MEVADNSTVRLDSMNEPQPDAILFIEPECGGQIRISDDDWLVVHHVPLASLREWLAAREAEGKLVDFKIHAALWLAGIGG